METRTSRKEMIMSSALATLLYVEGESQRPTHAEIIQIARESVQEEMKPDKFECVLFPPQKAEKITNIYKEGDSIASVVECRPVVETNENCPITVLLDENGNVINQVWC